MCISGLSRNNNSGTFSSSLSGAAWQRSSDSNLILAKKADFSDQCSEKAYRIDMGCNNQAASSSTSPLKKGTFNFTMTAVAWQRNCY
jgi:hypothetical protein